MKELTLEEKKYLDSLADPLYTSEFVSEWLNNDVNVFANAPAALQAMGVDGYYRAVKYSVKKESMIKAAVLDGFAVDVADCLSARLSVADMLADFITEVSFRDESVGVFGINDSEACLLDAIVSWLRAGGVNDET